MLLQPTPSTLDPSATESTFARAAAILHDGAHDVDELLAAAVRHQRELGRRVHGLLMTHQPPRSGCAAAMVMIDVSTGEPYRVSQAMGSGSRSCRADPQGFARASQVLRAALEAAPDLVVCNRFGGLEAEGGGFAAELLEVMVRGLPLLTAVASRNLEAWLRFSGGAAVLPADAQAVNAWIESVLAPA